MKASLKEKLKKAIQAFKMRQEASTTGTMAVATGGVQAGGDIGTTPFAFSRKGARPSVVHQAGFTPAKKVKKSANYKLENQMYSEPSYISPALNIEPVPTYTDKNGLVQHNDPEIDPNLVGFKQGQLPVTEGINGLKYEQEGQQTIQPAIQQTQPTAQTVVEPKINLTSYDVLPDFTSFDQKLKNSTESLKVNLQKTIQNRILGKKIVVRASKGFKQPEADYTINVVGVNIDYYYDRYVIIIVGREENKQKIAKFFIKPGFKIKILGNADKLKPKDRYQVAKSKALVQTEPQVTNSVTGDEEEKTPAMQNTQQTPQQPNQPKSA